MQFREKWVNKSRVYTQLPSRILLQISLFEEKEPVSKLRNNRNDFIQFNLLPGMFVVVNFRFAQNV